MTGLWSVVAGPVVATVQPTNRTGPTLVFIATVLVVLALLGTVVWRASRTGRPTDQRDTAGGAAAAETGPVNSPGGDEEAPADDA